jgi:hypothetical protein
VLDDKLAKRVEEEKKLSDLMTFQYKLYNEIDVKPAKYVKPKDEVRREEIHASPSKDQKVSNVQSQTKQKEIDVG